MTKGFLTARRRYLFLLPLVLLAAVTLPHLDQGDFRTDTGRYAAVGLQAYRAGLFWTPHLHPAVPYFSKPPLVLWIHGLALHLLGANLVAARLPSIAAAAGCVLLTIALARRFCGRATALAAGVVLTLTYEFFRRTREISLDMWLLLFMLAAVWIAVVAVQRERRGLLVAAGIPLGLALLCKPLTALLVLPILALWLGTRGARPAAWLLALGGTLLAALAVALPWHVSMVWQHGQAFTARYFGHEIADRMLGHMGTDGPLYYFAEIGRSYWPWILSLAAGFAAWATRPAARHHRDGLRLASIWLAIWALAITLSPCKSPRYELPLYPMAAIVGGYGLVRLPWRGLRRWYRRHLPATTVAAAACGLLIAALPIRFQAPPHPQRAQLVAWLQKQPSDRFYAGAFCSDDQGYLYLKTGRWPEPTARADGSAAADLPTGSALLYATNMDPSPGANETVVYKSAGFVVTRLGPGGWMPVWRGDRPSNY